MKNFETAESNLVFISTDLLNSLRTKNRSLHTSVQLRTGCRPLIIIMFTVQDCQQMDIRYFYRDLSTFYSWLNQCCYFIRIHPQFIQNRTLSNVSVFLFCSAMTLYSTFPYLDSLLTWLLYIFNRILFWFNTKWLGPVR